MYKMEDEQYRSMASMLKNVMTKITELNEIEGRLSDLYLIQEEKEEAEKYHKQLCLCMIQRKKYLQSQKYFKSQNPLGKR